MNINQAMQGKLQSGEVIDVSLCERTITGDYILKTFVDGSDYCDSKTERWIWSIAKLNRPFPSEMADKSKRILETGTYLASTGTRWYTGGDEDAGFTCVFLR